MRRRSITPRTDARVAPNGYLYSCRIINDKGLALKAEIDALSKQAGANRCFVLSHSLPRSVVGWSACIDAQSGGLASRL